MSEEIINLLANAPDLLVAARTSSFHFKGKGTTVSEIARELGVAHVLEGSIRRSGDHLRVTAQLIRADNGFHLWSETFDRELSDLFAVQDEIANAVAQALQIRLKGGELNRRKGGTQNLEAYELLLKANNASFQNTATSFDDAARYAQEAIDRDPNYGLAWSLLAYMNSGKVDNALIKWNDGYPRARELALHALDLSPDIAEAHALLEHLNVMLDWDWSAAQRERKLALAIDPTDPITLQLAAVHENALGRWDEAEKLIQTGLQARSVVVVAAVDAMRIRTTVRAASTTPRPTYRKLMEVEPNFQWTRMYAARIPLQKGDIEAASAALEKETDPTILQYFRPNIYWLQGREEEADAALKQAIEQFGDINAYAIAQMYVVRGDLDRAFEWLEKAYEQKNTGLLEIVAEPLFKNLCGDPRFDAFMRRMNMPVVKSYPFHAEARS